MFPSVTSTPRWASLVRAGGGDRLRGEEDLKARGSGGRERERGRNTQKKKKLSSSTLKVERRPSAAAARTAGGKMARRGGRATSRCSARIPGAPAGLWLWLLPLMLLPSAAEAGLYTASDQISPLTPENVGSVLGNSSTAIVVEFYASWCGHCIAFSPVYKSLARDIAEWKPAVDLAAIDCAAEENRKVCTGLSIRGYPTLKFFHAYSKADSTGLDLRGFPRDVRGLRRLIIDQMEKHQEPWPPACPPLEPTSQAELNSFFENNNVQHLALIFEEPKSYIGREVTLDLLQFENIAVRRVLSTEEDLVNKLGVTDFPSCYLYYPTGNFIRLQVNIEARTFYSYALQRLPGVVRSGKPPPIIEDIVDHNSTQQLWRPFNRSRVYMADLESTLHYSLRVELAAHPIIKGEALSSLKKYISVLAKLFPGRPMVKNLLQALDVWLQNQPGDHVFYEAFREILDNSRQAPDMALPEGERWVGCQGSRPDLRRYPCGVWTLFHVLTVQAKKSGGLEAREVLGAMRGYVRNFFGCRPCAEHFENMARESLMEVNTLSAAVLWLWSRHNRVNNRLAGALSEDPNFPKIQWPLPETCSACHTVQDNGEHRWNQEQVLPFLLSHFSSGSILTDYLKDESQVLEKQRERRASQQLALEARERVERKAREAVTPFPSSQHAAKEEEREEEEEEEEEDEEEEEEERPQDETIVDGEEGLEGAATVDELQGKPTPWTKPERGGIGRRRRANRKPSIVGMRIRDPPEDIVDLDSFVNQHYKAKAPQVATSSRVKQRTLQRKEEQDPEPVFGLSLELDAGVGMVGLQPLESEPGLEPGPPRKRLQKRELTGQRLNAERRSHRRRWMSVLSIGFSEVDISLCVVLYFLSFTCLLAMYLFFKQRLRLRRVKVSLP